MRIEKGIFSGEWTWTNFYAMIVTNLVIAMYIGFVALVMTSAAQAGDAQVVAFEDPLHLGNVQDFDPVVDLEVERERCEDFVITLAKLHQDGHLKTSTYRHDLANVNHCICLINWLISEYSKKEPDEDKLTDLNRRFSEAVLKI